MNTCILYSLLVTTLSTSALIATDVAPKFLVRIFNDWKQGAVTIKSTDPSSGTIVYRGSHYSNKQDEFNVADITSLNYVVPHEFNGAIIITVTNAQGTVISAASLQEKGGIATRYEGGRYVSATSHERSGYIRLTKITGRVSEGTWNVNPSAVINDKPALNTVAISIDSTGTISITKLLTISLLNATGAPLEVGSPDCSTESIDKIFGRVGSDAEKRHNFTMLFNPSNCKLVATTVGASSRQVPIGSQATACITEKWDLSDHCKNCSFDESGDYICCHTDPLTGENVCQSEGIAWVRGRVTQNGVHVLIDYGVVPRKK